MNEPDWVGGQAACLDAWDLFCPPEGQDWTREDRQLAVTMCQSCPMLAECRTWAVESGYTTGVIAGVDMTDPWSHVKRAAPETPTPTRARYHRRA